MTFNAFRDPKRLCQFLLKRCLDKGVQLHQPAKALSVSKDTKDCLTSIRIASQDGVETDGKLMIPICSLGNNLTRFL
jgi:hypothetical protein